MQVIAIHIAVVEQLEAEVYVVEGTDEVVASALIGIAAGTDTQQIGLDDHSCQLTSVAIGGGPTCGRAGGGGGCVGYL